MKIVSSYTSLFISLFISIIPNYIHAEDKLLYKADFEYLGAFRVPKSDMGGPLYSGLSYGGYAIAYNPTNNSLLITGSDQSQLTAEIGIPAIVKSNNISDLNTASVIHNLIDTTDGNRRKILADGTTEMTSSAVKIGGMMKWGGMLIGSAYSFFDGDYSAVRSHFVTNFDLSLKTFKGMLQLGTPPTVPQAGYIAGYMTPIPNNWQDRLGGKALSGMSGLSVSTRTSYGPAAFSFNPNDLVAGTSPVNATALLYYDEAHPSLGGWDASGGLHNMGSFQRGVIFPTGTRSIIFTGRHSLGTACYGQGTNIIEEASQDGYCYDPLDQTKGTHGYPYAMYAWVYDANDLARVKARRRIVNDPSDNLVDGVAKTSTEKYKPWHIKPYTYWEIKLPFVDNKSGATGASAYDEQSKRLYLVQYAADTDWPIIHAFQIKIDSIPDSAPRIEMIKLAQ